MNQSASAPPNLRHLTPTYLYNMLQDFRHLLVFDFREDFSKEHIRDSFHVEANIKKEDIMSVIDLAEQKATEKELKYKGLQRVRRFFMLGDSQLDSGNERVAMVLDCLGQRLSKEDKYYALSQSFAQFATTYPFMLIKEDKLKTILEEKGEKEMQKERWYPYAKFPSQIIPGKLYVSSIYSSNSQRQLNDLGIIHLVDFIEYKQEEKLADFKKNHQNYTHIPLNPDVPMVLDFDQLNQTLDSVISGGKTLLYCRDGENISPTFAVGYLMYKAGLNVQMATLKVCQAISRVELNKMIYTQLLVYQPKKK